MGQGPDLAGAANNSLAAEGTKPAAGEGRLRGTGTAPPPSQRDHEQGRASSGRPSTQPFLSGPNSRSRPLRDRLLSAGRKGFAESVLPLPEPGQGSLWAVFLFAAGIGCYRLLPEEPHLLSLLLLFAVFALPLLRRAVRPGQAVPALSRLYWVGLLLSAGVLCACVRTAFVAAPRLEAPVSVRFVGQVQERQAVARGERLLVTIHHVLDQNGTVLERARIRSPRLRSLPGMKVRIRVAQGGAAPVLPGDWVRVFGRLFPPKGPVHPGGYDFSFWAYFSGIGASGFSFGAPEVLPAGHPGAGRAGVGTGEYGALSAPGMTLALKRFVTRVRLALKARILQATGTQQSGQIAVALLTGDRSGLSEATQELLRQAGLAHVLAISGLHMALFAGGVYAGAVLLLALPRSVCLRYPTHKLAAGAGLAMAGLYLLLSGASVPTQRSFVMVGLVLLARMTDRRGVTLHSVALAGGALLLIAPERLFAPGFQMSFAAVISLVAVYESWRRWRGAARDGFIPQQGAGARVLRQVATYGLGLLVTSLVAGLATGLIAAHHFGRIAPYGLLGNLLAMPVFSLLVMPLGALSLLVMPLGLSSIPLAGMALAADWVLGVAAFVEAMGSSGTEARFGAVRPPGGVSAALLSSGLLGLLLLRRFKRVWGGAALACGLGLHQLERPPDLQIADSGQVIALRDGQGQLVASAGRASFQTDTWFAVEGETGAFRSAPAAVKRCDDTGCVFTLAVLDPPGTGAVAFGGSEKAAPGRGRGDSETEIAGRLQVALTRDMAAFKADCALADSVVSRLRAPADCAAPLIVDADRLARTGAVSLWFSRDKRWGYQPFFAAGHWIEDRQAADHWGIGQGAIGREAKDQGAGDQGRADHWAADHWGPDDWGPDDWELDNRAADQGANPGLQAVAAAAAGADAAQNREPGSGAQPAGPGPQPAAARVYVKMRQALPDPKRPWTP